MPPPLPHDPYRHAAFKRGVDLLGGPRRTADALGLTSDRSIRNWVGGVYAISDGVAYDMAAALERHAVGCKDAAAGLDAPAEAPARAGPRA